MATATETQTEAVEGQAGAIVDVEKFLSMSDVELRLTYGFLPAPIVIPCKLILDDDEKAARQKFYSQPAADQAAGEHAYHVEMLASIVVGKPSGLPGFDELAKEFPAANRWGDVLRKYFSVETPLSKKIAAEAIDTYSRMTAPAEFFR